MRYNILKNQKGTISIIFAILFPLFIVLFVFSFNSIHYINTKSRLNNALREANLANGVISKEQDKKAKTKSYLKAFLPDINIKDIEIRVENSSINNLTASILEKGIFNKNDKESLIKENVRVQPSQTANDTDFAFVIDFSQSMNDKFDLTDIKKGMCSTSNKDYDEEFCRRIITSRGIGIIAIQAIIKKIIKELSKQKNINSTYSIIPFTEAIQKQELTKFYPKQMVYNYILPFSLKDEFSLKDYDFWSGIISSNCSKGKNEYTFEKDLDYSTHPEVNKAKKLFNALSREVCDTEVSEKLTDILDYEKSIINMFDLDKAFKFRLYSSVDTNILTPKQYKRPHGLAWLGDFVFSNPNRTKREKISRSFIFEEIERTDIKNGLNQKVEEVLTKHAVGGKTLVMSGFLRAIGHLAEGNNLRKVLILFTDGTDSAGGISKSSEIEDTFIDKKLCQNIEKGLKDKGAKEVDIYVFNINDPQITKDFTQRWLKCTSEEKVISSHNFDEFFKKFKKTIYKGSEFGKFTLEKEKAKAI